MKAHYPKARILIVDDQEANVRLLERLLKRVGYTCLQTTTDPRKVQPLLGDFNPDIILLDILMPHLNGFEVLTQLKQQLPEDGYLPIVVLTADVNDSTKQRALEAGASDFITKPFDSTEVLLRVDNLLRTRFLHRSLKAQNEALEAKVRERTQQLVQRKQVLQLLNELPAGGETFFEALVKALTEILDLRWTFVGRLFGDSRVEAFALQGLDPFSYDLPGAPCQNVIEDGFCYYPCAVAELFPEDRALVEMGVEAYAGIPLGAKDGRVSGILVGLHDLPLTEEDSDFFRFVFETFAQRASTELLDLEHRTRLEFTADAHLALRPAQTPEEVFKLATKAALDGTRASGSFLALYRSNDDCLEIMAPAGYLAEFAQGKKLYRGQGLTWHVFDSGKSLYIPDVSIHSDTIYFTEQPIQAPYLGVPLSDPQGQVLGALVINTAKDGGELSPLDSYYLEVLAQAAGAAIARMQILQDVTETREESLRIVGLTLEYRDFETKGHTDRVTELALRLGKALGVDAEALQHLRWGGYLHDTGKIAIPDQILLKPGRLTPEEFEVIKGHVTIGEEMLSQLHFLPKPVLEIIRHHHERWDGSGYPDGLAGKDIPLLACVFSVVDVYDALTSERPYKHAWSHEEAVAELVKQKGKQFNPHVVDTLLKVLKK